MKTKRWLENFLTILIMSLVISLFLTTNIQKTIAQIEEPTPTPVIGVVPDSLSDVGLLTNIQSEYVRRGFDSESFTVSYYDSEDMSEYLFSGSYSTPIDFYLECFDESYPYNGCKLIPELSDGMNYSVQWQGDIIIPIEGIYTFSFENVDDGVRLFLDGNEVADRNWYYPYPDIRVPPISLNLSEGSHSFRIDYEQRPYYIASLQVRWSGPNFSNELIPVSDLNCSDPQIYDGVHHCTIGASEILFIDPDYVRFETVLAEGYNRNTNWEDPIKEECEDTNVPDFILEYKSTGPGCYIDGKFPAEFVGRTWDTDKPGMVDRYLDAIIAFNADYFDNPGLEHGPEGLTVKNGNRFDGRCYNDKDENSFDTPHLAISKYGDIQIDIAEVTDTPEICNEDGKPYVTDPDKYRNTVGGGPILVKDGAINNLDGPDKDCRRGRTAVGKTLDGEMIVIVEPDPEQTLPCDQRPFGLTLAELADLMILLGATDAINLDGGGSSQLWYNDDYLVSSSRPVPEGLLIFQKTYTVTGQIKDDHGNFMEGVLVSVGSSATTTDSSGNYYFTWLKAGNYEIRPSKEGYSFDPPVLPVTVPPDAIGQDFVGTTCAVKTALNSYVSSSFQQVFNTVDLIILYQHLRDDVFSTTIVGQDFIADFEQYGPDVTEILLTNSELRSRTAQFLENAAPLFSGLLPDSTEEIKLTQGLYDEAEDLLYDLAGAGSPELSNVMIQTWKDLALDDQIGEAPTEIWQEMNKLYIYLPLARK